MAKATPIQRMYRIEKGTPIAVGDTTVLLPELKLNFLEFVRPEDPLSARARKYLVPDSDRVSFTDNPIANTHIFQGLVKEFQTEAVRQQYIQKSVDRVRYSVTAIAEAGFKTKLIATAKLKVVSDPTIRVDPLFLKLAPEDPVPKNATIYFRIIEDRVTGSKKIAVHPLMSRFTIDFDGDVINFSAFRVKINGTAVNGIENNTGIGATNIYGIHKTPWYSSFNNIERDGGKGSAHKILSYFRTTTQEDVENHFGSAQSIAEAFVSGGKLKRFRTNKELEEVALANTVKDMIGQVHNSTWLMDLQNRLSVEFADTFNPAEKRILRETFGRFFHENGEMQFSGKRMAIVEEVIKAQVRQKQVLTHQGIMSVLDDLKMSPEARKEYARKKVDTLSSTDIVGILKRQLNGPDSLINSLANNIHKGMTKDDILGAQEMALEYERIAKPKVQNLSILDRVFGSGLLREHISGRQSVFEHMTTSGYSPILGGDAAEKFTTGMMTLDNQRRTMRMGYAVGDVLAKDDVGRWKRFSGSEFMRQELGRYLEDEDFIVKDYRSLDGKRMLGSATGRFSYENLIVGSDTNSDLIGLLQHGNDILGTNYIRSDLVGKTEYNKQLLKKLVVAHDRKLYSSKFAKIDSALKDAVSRYGVMQYYRDDGVIHPEQAAKLDRAVVVDTGYERLDDPSIVGKILTEINSEDLGVDPVAMRRRDSSHGAALQILNYVEGHIDPKRAIKIQSQMANSLTVRSNLMIISMDQQKLMRLHGYSAENRARLFAPGIQNNAESEGEGFFGVFSSFFEKADAKNIEVGGNPWGARKYDTKIIDRGFKVESTSFNGTSPVAITNGGELPVDAITDFDNIRTKEFARQLGLIDDEGQLIAPNATFKTQDMHGNDITVQGHLIQHDLNITQTAQDFAGHTYSDIYRDAVEGPEYLQLTRADTAAAYVQLHKRMAGRDLTREETEGVLRRLAEPLESATRSEIEENFKNKTYDLQHAFGEFLKIQDFLENKSIGTDIASGILKQTAAASANAAAEKLGMLKALELVLGKTL